MKKVFALFVIASAFTFAACGGKKTEGAEGADTTAVVDTLAPSTEMAPVDTAAADTSAKVDTAAAPATEAPAAH
ncbi:MAG: hypothetical protein ACOVMN_13140 [Flexibacteraceae bacterium]